MEWKPLSLDELTAMIERDLAACSPEARSFFERVRFPPVKWRQTPWGDDGGGFWAVAALGNQVLWRGCGRYRVGRRGVSVHTSPGKRRKRIPRAAPPGLL